MQVRSSAHDSRVDLARPPWEYTSPEDAAVLEGWESRIPAAAARSLSEPAPAAPSALALAWQLYRRGQYDASAKAFAALTTSADRSEALNARLGLAYSLIKQGRRDQAISHLYYLVEQGYRPAETRLALLYALLQSGRWAQAQEQIKRLPVSERALWEKRLLEARLLKEYSSLGQAAAPSELSAFLDAHAEALSACIRPDIFHDIASRLMVAGDPQRATDLRRRTPGMSSDAGPAPGDRRRAFDLAAG